MNLTYAQDGHEIRCSNDDYNDIYFLCNKISSNVFCQCYYYLYILYSQRYEFYYTVL